MHGRAQVPPDHPGQPVRLPVQRHRPALDLLVVHQLDREQPGELVPEAAGARVGISGEVVAAEHLLQVPLGDEVPHGGPPVAGQHDPVITGRGHDGGAVRQVPNDLAHRASYSPPSCLKDRMTSSGSSSSASSMSSRIAPTSSVSSVPPGPGGWPPGSFSPMSLLPSGPTLSSSHA